MSRVAGRYGECGNAAVAMHCSALTFALAVVQSKIDREAKVAYDRAASMRKLTSQAVWRSTASPARL